MLHRLILTMMTVLTPLKVYSNELNKWLALSGSVIDSGGVPLENVEVYLCKVDAADAATYSSWQSSSDDEDITGGMVLNLAENQAQPLRNYLQHSKVGCFNASSTSRGSFVVGFQEAVSISSPYLIVVHHPTMTSHCDLLSFNIESSPSLVKKLETVVLSPSQRQPTNESSLNSMDVKSIWTKYCLAGPSVSPVVASSAGTDPSTTRTNSPSLKVTVMIIGFTALLFLRQKRWNHQVELNGVLHSMMPNGEFKARQVGCNQDTESDLVIAALDNEQSVNFVVLSYS